MCPRAASTRASASSGIYGRGRRYVEAQAAAEQDRWDSEARFRTVFAEAVIGIPPFSQLLSILPDDKIGLTFARTLRAFSRAAWMHE